MQRLMSAIAVAALLAGGSAALTPAAAQPPHIIVRGATPILPPPAYVFGNGSAYDWYDYTGINDDPFSPYYDPAGRIPDTRYYGPKAVDLTLARTLDRNNESMLRHMLVCQASYSTYNPVSNTYYGRDGIPVPCYR